MRRGRHDGRAAAGSPVRARPRRLLRLPVATPTACPPSVNGSTSGRRSPWVGHVDVSVFIRSDAGKTTVAALRAAIAALPQVRRSYFESQDQAWAEFQRLYTCSARVPRSQVPASYRIVLSPATRQQRDDVVRTLSRLPGVESVSCDPSSPCTNLSSPAPAAP